MTNNFTREYSKLINPASIKTTTDFAQWAAWELHVRARDDSGRCVYCQSTREANHTDACPITRGLLVNPPPPPPRRQRFSFVLSCEVCGAPFTAKSRNRRHCEVHRLERRKESQKQSNLRLTQRRREQRNPHPRGSK